MKRLPSQVWISVFRNGTQVCALSTALIEGAISGGSRIVLGGTQTPKFAENCMKMKEFGPRGSRPWRPNPLNLTMAMKCSDRNAFTILDTQTQKDRT